MRGTRGHRMANSCSIWIHLLDRSLPKPEDILDGVLWQIYQGKEVCPSPNSLSEVWFQGWTTRFCFLTRCWRLNFPRSMFTSFHYGDKTACIGNPPYTTSLWQRSDLQSYLQHKDPQFSKILRRTSILLSTVLRVHTHCTSFIQCSICIWRKLFLFDANWDIHYLHTLNLSWSIRAWHALFILLIETYQEAVSKVSGKDVRCMSSLSTQADMH